MKDLQPRVESVIAFNSYVNSLEKIAAGIVDKVDDVARLSNKLTKGQRAVLDLQDVGRVAGGTTVGGIVGGLGDNGGSNDRMILGMITGAMGASFRGKINRKLVDIININRLRKGQSLTVGSPLMNLQYLK